MGSLINHLATFANPILCFYYLLLLLVTFARLQTAQPRRTLYSLPDGTNTTSSSFARQLQGYYSSNPIDDCWRGDANWAKNRMKLAQCAVGFGSNAIGGKGGQIYVVTDSSDNSAVNPKLGTLRYGVVQLQPLWIIFSHDMTITLRTELIVASHKTLDGRGANVHITGQGCITVQDVTNIIIHGLRITDCKPSSPGIVMSSTAHIGHRKGSDGDGISIYNAQNIWVDHNYLANCHDGLVDAIHGSTAITISNNQFAYHDKVMLLGHNDAFLQDKGMKVSVVYNHFGPGCVQRMPRCRLGYFHVAYNDFESWEMYAIGGTANPTILSEGNRFVAANAKEVTKRDCHCSSGSWSGWKWTSSNDIMVNGAYFVESGQGYVKPVYGGSLQSSSYKPSMTANSGPLSCAQGSPC